MRISIIAALGRNWVIGNGNKLPWHLPADLKRFKELTKNHTVVMGRKTAESLSWKPLKDRLNLVVTNSLEQAQVKNGFLTVKKIRDAIAVAEMTGEQELFFIGGAKIFEAALHLVDRMYLTIINADFEGDAEFPEIDFGDDKLWDLKAAETRLPDSKNAHELHFTVWDRAFGNYKPVAD
ncbi:MAG: dihydrofolate reductase [Patescibacteria group bacterium]